MRSRLRPTAGWRSSRSTAIRVGMPGTDGSIIRVIDLKAGRIAGTIDFGKGVRPHCAVFGPKDGLLMSRRSWTGGHDIDPATLKIVGSIPTGMPQSHMLAIRPTGSAAIPPMSRRARSRCWT